MKTKSVPLTPMPVTTPASTWATELSIQAVETVPNCTHLTMKLNYTVVKLTKRLGLLYNSNIHRLVANLVTLAKMSPHLL